MKVTEWPENMAAKAQNKRVTLSWKDVARENVFPGLRIQVLNGVWQMVEAGSEEIQTDAQLDPNEPAGEADCGLMDFRNRLQMSDGSGRIYAIDIDRMLNFYGYYSRSTKI